MKIFSFPMSAPPPQSCLLPVSCPTSPTTITLFTHFAAGYEDLHCSKL